MLHSNRRFAKMFSFVATANRLALPDIIYARHILIQCRKNSKPKRKQSSSNCKVNAGTSDDCLSLSVFSFPSEICAREQLNFEKNSIAVMCRLNIGLNVCLFDCNQELIESRFGISQAKIAATEGGVERKVPKRLFKSNSDSEQQFNYFILQVSIKCRARENCTAKHEKNN